MTALDNILLPLDLAHRRPRRGWLVTVLDTVQLRARLLHRPSQLSGGEQQRVAVARGLVSRPAVLFADEPTGSLDSRRGSEILEFMQQAVRDLGQTIIMVTHDPTAASYADRTVLLADGRVVDQLEHPTTASLIDRMKQLGA